MPPSHATPLTLRTGLVLPNRIVVPPMASGTADAHGTPTEQTRAQYEHRARSGAGLVFVEYTAISEAGRSEPNQLLFTSTSDSDGFAQLARLIRAHGAVPGLQLTHAGGKTERALTGGILQSPSGIPVPVKDRTLETPDAMTHEDIADWRADFVDAAVRAIDMGFSIVEFHAAHGYGLSQWLSPLTNVRSDAYGGSSENRARLLCEILCEVKKQRQQATLAVRIGARDFLDGGLEPNESLKIARLLVDAGCDLLDVSSGIGGWRRPQSREARGEGYLVPEAATLQQHIDVPVIGVGGIETLAFIDGALARGDFQLAAVGRAVLEGRFQVRGDQPTFRDHTCL